MHLVYQVFVQCTARGSHSPLVWISVSNSQPSASVGLCRCPTATNHVAARLTTQNKVRWLFAISVISKLDKEVPPHQILYVKVLLRRYFQTGTITFPTH